MSILKLLAFFSERFLAAPVYPLELLKRAFLSGPLGVRATSGMAGGQFAGLTALSSGTATVTVSTTQIKSDSIVNATFAVATTCGSGIGYNIGVSSIVHGVSFNMGYFDGQGRAPGGTIMWEIKRTS